MRYKLTFKDAAGEVLHETKQMRNGLPWHTPLADVRHYYIVSCGDEFSAISDGASVCVHTGFGWKGEPKETSFSRDQIANAIGGTQFGNYAPRPQELHHE